jgi:hypothetical protein
MSLPTQHGENIANDIQTEDAYGDFNVLTTADVWLILDNLHTHFMDNGSESHSNLMDMLSSWMQELEQFDNELPPF